MSQYSRKNTRRKPMGEINVVPYIDVTLVLLIIFMITTPMLQTGVEVDLPEAESKVVEIDVEANPPIIVTVKSEHDYLIRINNEDDKAIPEAEITPTVMQILAEKPKTQVLINADKTIEYGVVVSVMAALKNAGVPTVGLMTKPSEHSEP
ncbi:protein TolR [Methylocucumis oryzae]|uniref:Tol-Pal system protein TolR n=1 Tax=Methylocucumis oryzae TaxID=1632867 RepID=A0A0F3IFR7_9GAMM|nr:protein TolR [Methylocucumis oryzae]KJV05581.1 biopolymer transporter TolR [Methylocucumis oryzae]